MNLIFKNFMNRIKLYFAVLLFLVVSSPAVFAQTTSPTSATLEEQFRSMKETSNSYQDYKVVKETLLNQFYSNVRDSIYAIKQRNLEAQSTITSQQQEIKRLQEELENQQKVLQENEFEIANTQVLGMNIEKETYNYIVWGIILALLILFAIAILKYKSSNRVAVKKRNEYETLDNEFNDFKARSREKEIKLMRDLQTERNAVEELNQRLAASQKNK